MASCTLVAVAGGATYTRYALALMETARKHFRPCEEMHYLILEGEEGWPQGTATRYRTLLQAWPETDYTFLIDADMRIDAPVGPEILPAHEGFRVSATLHPGYIGMPAAALPFETRTESAAYVEPEAREVYYCGGFVGGEKTAFRIMAFGVDAILKRDALHGLMPVWHDESCMNAALVRVPPNTVLPPSYAYPDNDLYYVQHVWDTSYERKITALDKPSEHRIGR